MLHPFWRSEPGPGMPLPWFPNNAIEKFEQTWVILHKYNLENENRGDAKVRIFPSLLAALADIRQVPFQGPEKAEFDRWMVEYVDIMTRFCSR